MAKKTNTLLWVGGGVAVAGLAYWFGWHERDWYVIVQKDNEPLYSVGPFNRTQAKQYADYAVSRGWTADLNLGPTSAQSVLTPEEGTYFVRGLGVTNEQVHLTAREGWPDDPYHGNSSHQSPFLFGLGKAERMKAEAWKDGRKSWVDITPAGGPRMRVTHQIFAGERGAGY